ncbi:hypothetical protein FKW77_008272 [Venturia effusa]|uniref:Uncharacterized protein n=1 Tax=Venturia effusa TaxID=50376 RepID=A0A517KWZ1_9PEZI|nr:hypothetical protein FKW77_008272 [Venturia effusa]
MEVAPTIPLAARDGDVAQFEIVAGAFTGTAEDMHVAAVRFGRGHGAGYVFDCDIGYGDAGGWFALRLHAILKHHTLDLIRFRVTTTLATDTSNAESMATYTNHFTDVIVLAASNGYAIVLVEDGAVGEGNHGGSGEAETIGIVRCR